MIDLCKLFGVEEGEEFKIIDSKCENNNKYVIEGGQIYYNSLVHEHYWSESHLELNEINGAKIIKLPKKKQFTDDELAIMRSLPKNYRWIVRDLGIDCAVAFKYKPTKNKYENWVSEGDCCILSIFNHLFKSITSEDEEPVFIDDYVERGAEC